MTRQNSNTEEQEEITGNIDINKWYWIAEYTYWCQGGDGPVEGVAEFLIDQIPKQYVQIAFTTEPDQ